MDPLSNKIIKPKYLYHQILQYLQKDCMYKVRKKMQSCRVLQHYELCLQPQKLFFNILMMTARGLLPLSLS